MMKLNPHNDKKSKADLSAAKRVIEQEDEYRYNIVISRKQMAKYLNLCRTRRVSAQNEIKRFIELQLKRYDELI